MRDLEQHPLSAAFPRMNESDHAALTADILHHGQREPITIFEGKILDGYHRYRSCLKLGEIPIFRTLDADADPVAFVMSCNLHRRHLDGSQRAHAVVACRSWARAGDNQHQRGGQAPGARPQTNEEMARAAEVGVTTIKQAKAAISGGLGDAIRDGKITVKNAAAFGKTPKSWIVEGGDQLLNDCNRFGVTLQQVWDARCIMAISAELGMKLWRGEMETEEAKAIVINDDLELARRVWSGELALSLYEFEAMREAAAKDTAWITAAVASKLVTQTLLHD